MTEMTAQAAAALRAPFSDAAVGHKPTVWCRACRDSRSKVCDQHQKTRCQKCRQNVTSAHTDLAFVGHAEVTDRLLQVDPAWYWEPLAYTPEGLPAIDRETGGLWIRLTVCGVTRIGFGDAEGKNGPSAIKELVGDAVRVTAMRFGVGLDLWGASGRGEAQAQAAVEHAADDSPTPAVAQPVKAAAEPKRPSGNGAKQEKPVDPRAQAWTVAWNAAKAMSMSREEFATDFQSEFGVTEKEGTAEQFTTYGQQLQMSLDAASDQVATG